MEEESNELMNAKEMSEFFRETLREIATIIGVPNYEYKYQLIDAIKDLVDYRNNNIEYDDFVDAILNFDANSDRVSYEEMEQQLKDHDLLVEMVDNISNKLKNLMGEYWDIAYREGDTGQHLSEEANKVIFSFENNLKALCHIAKWSN